MPRLSRAATLGQALGQATRGFAPLDLDGCALWLSADELGLADGAKVARWPDKSGRGRDATQGTEGAKPTYKTGIVNGRSVLRFDGVGTYLDTGAISALETDKITAFMVIQKNATADNRIAMRSSYWNGATISGSNDQMWGIIAGSAQWMAAARNAAGSQGTSVAAVTTAWSILSEVWAADNSLTLYTNGVGAAPAAGLDATPTGHRFTRIGANSLGTGPAGFLSGDLAEVIIYARELSASERQRIEQYLSIKYGIALA